MAQLAILGHKTRGNEVIEILEMLGGSNPHNYSAHCDSFCFYIGKNTNSIYYDWVRNCDEDENILIFTLEEFLEKYPYKVGDKVKVCGDNLGVIIGMRWECGYVVYKVKLSKNGYETSKTSENLQPYEETPLYLNEKANKQAEEIAEILEPAKEIMEGVYAYNEINCYHQDFGDKVRIRLGGDYEIKTEEGKTYIVRKKPQHPKNYEECCKVLDIQSDWHLTFELNNPVSCDLCVKNEFEYVCKLEAFRKLLICRDAYWKIAGEQMRLGKPWKPQFENCSIPHYCIFINHIGEIYDDCFYGSRCLLAFPTAEMKDAFYENFKELIEQCKELL